MTPERCNSHREWAESLGVMALIAPYWPRLEMMGKQMEPVTRGHTQKSLCWFKWLVGGSELVAVSLVTDQLSPHSVPSPISASDHLGGKHIIQVYFWRDEHHHSAGLSWECHPARHEDHRGVRWVPVCMHPLPAPSSGEAVRLLATRGRSASTQRTKGSGGERAESGLVSSSEGDVVHLHSYGHKTRGAFIGLCSESGSSALTHLKWDRMGFITRKANSFHLVFWRCLNNENPL